MTRLNFPYFMNETAVKYIIEAVKMVAREGWKLLPQVCILYYYTAPIDYLHINRTHGMLQMPPATPWLPMLGYSCIVLHCIVLHCLGCLFACVNVCVY